MKHKSLFIKALSLFSFILSPMAIAHQSKKLVGSRKKFHPLTKDQTRWPEHMMNTVPEDFDVYVNEGDELELYRADCHFSELDVASINRPFNLAVPLIK